MPSSKSAPFRPPASGPLSKPTPIDTNTGSRPYDSILITQERLTEQHAAELKMVRGELSTARQSSDKHKGLLVEEREAHALLKEDAEAMIEYVQTAQQVHALENKAFWEERRIRREKEAEYRKLDLDVQRNGCLIDRWIEHANTIKFQCQHAQNDAQRAHRQVKRLMAELEDEQAHTKKQKVTCIYSLLWKKQTSCRSRLNYEIKISSLMRPSRLVIRL